jgi:hypothetical protein
MSECVAAMPNSRLLLLPHAPPRVRDPASIGESPELALYLSLAHSALVLTAADAHDHGRHGQARAVVAPCL